MTILKHFSRSKRTRIKGRDRSVNDTSRATPSFFFKVYTLFIPLFSCALLWGAFATHILYRLPSSTENDFVVGQRVHADIYAQVDFDYEDLEETVIKRQQAANSVLDTYRIDASKIETTVRYFRDLFKLINAEIKKIDTQNLPDRHISETVLSLYESLHPEQINSLIPLFDSDDKKTFFLEAIQAALHKGIISPDEISEHFPVHKKINILDERLRKVKADFALLRTPQIVANELVENFVLHFGLNNPTVLSDIAQNVIAELILSNLQHDATLTIRERKKVREELPPVKKWVTEGSVFLRKGSVVSNQDRQKLIAHQRAYSAKIDSSQYYFRMILLLTISLLSIIFGALYLFHQHQELFEKKSNFILVAVTLTINIFLIKFVKGILLLFINGPPVFISPALPLAFSSIFLTILVGKKLGLSAGIFMALLASLTGEDFLHVFVLGLFTSSGGALSVRSARTRTRTFRGAIAITVIIFVVESVFSLINIAPWSTYLQILAVGAANGFLTLLLVNLLLPVTEYVFGITTSISLLELSDLNHPLLKRLQIEAPGTYHHTLMVASLSEQAAEAIGGNSLLARVSTYFHDIGKLSNPSYFTENSFGIDRHEDLSPRMSSLIILNHVKEGLVMAKKYKLKKPIRDVIASHHGTSLVYYFYQRAVTRKEKSEKDKVYEEDFRYPGPLPVSKEESIISLADSCEAASRSLQKPTPQKIRTLVSEIFQNKILDGQLNDSELSMAEVKIVEEVITKTLTTMLHGRIAYPKVELDEDNLNQQTKSLSAGSEEAIPENTSNGSQAQRSENVVATP